MRRARKRSRVAPMLAPARSRGTSPNCSSSAKAPRYTQETPPPPPHTSTSAFSQTSRSSAAGREQERLDDGLQLLPERVEQLLEVEVDAVGRPQEGDPGQVERVAEGAL